MGKAVLFTYDSRGNLLAVEDPNTGIERYEYDRNNRLKRVIRPLLQETYFEHDPVGNLTDAYDANGQRIHHTYDEANRRIQTDYYEAGDHVNPVKTVTFSYDSLNRLTGYDDGTTSAVYTYDALGRKITETVDYGPFSLGHAYTYYANGRKKTFVGPDGVLHEYAYDDANRLSGINVATVGAINYSNYQWNRPGKVTVPGGGTREYDYDPFMRIEAIVAKYPGENLLMSYGYEYSPAGNVTTKSTENGVYTYGYDDIYRLESIDNPILADEAYTYDNMGNRATEAGAVGDGRYNLNNELQSYGEVSYEYDENGNTTRKSDGAFVTLYHWDVSDQLVQVADGGGGVVAEYGYDPFGQEEALEGPGGAVDVLRLCRRGVGGRVQCHWIGGQGLWVRARGDVDGGSGVPEGGWHILLVSERSSGDAAETGGFEWDCSLGRGV